jgi:hypothetical protein
MRPLRCSTSTYRPIRRRCGGAPAVQRKGFRTSTRAGDAPGGPRGPRQQQALYQYQQAIQTAFRETEDALVAQLKLREQLTVQARRVTALKGYARLARLRYENGYTSFLEVLDAERSLFLAELDYARNQGDLFQALVNIYKAMGGGWVMQANALAPGPNLDVQANPPVFP